MEFTAWSVLTDLGLVSLLLLIGIVLRAKIKIVQKLFLPAGIIAGLLGLLLGPNGFGVLPFSSAIGSYPGILIAIIFGALPLSSEKVQWKSIKKRVGNMWAYSQIAMILQWGGGVLFALLLILPFWSEIPTGFGLILAAGFVGGHGTAAAIGQAFSTHGWEDAASLAMTSATIGIIAAIVVGMFFIKRSSETGDTNYISSFKELPEELRTGLIPQDKRKSIGNETVSPISVDPLILHLSLIGFIAMCGYYLSQFGATLIPNVSIPAFSVAFIIGLIVQKLLTATKTEHYVDKNIINRLSSGATDLLVAFGIASISLPVVVQYALPLSLLLGFGLIYCWFIFRIFSQKFFEQQWFERGIFTWGWTTGTMAMGIALLRIVDPELKSKTLDDWALVYIPMAPVEIAVVTFAPLLMVTGQHWLFVLATLGFGFGILLFSRLSGWMVKKKPQSQKI